MAVLAAKMSKIEEASKKKDEQANLFILQTREALEQKMETHTEKREAYLSDLKAKLKDHVCISQFSSFCLCMVFEWLNVGLSDLGNGELCFTEEIVFTWHLITEGC
jgi:hypothetical protein